jgi:hypothetical protein
MPADREAQNSSNQSLKKIALTAHLLRRELYRLKLKRVDLPKADLRLGEKAYATGATEAEPELDSGSTQLRSVSHSCGNKRSQHHLHLGRKPKRWQTGLERLFRLER